jgi:predicted TIM-barrel fold metal-dependent hydrolase
MRLSRYQPESLLVVEHEKLERAAYPAIDMHFHLESLDPSMTPERLVQAMDAAGISQVVNLGGTPGDFERFTTTFAARYPDRFIMFVKPNFGAALRRKDGVAEQVKWVERAAAMGARGIKVSKSLGMGIKDSDGRIAPVDDPRLDPIWAKAGELGMPVLIHTSDAPAFFNAPDGSNERYEEIISSPEWSRYGKPPSYKELLAQRDNVIARHPGTVFIGAHMGMSEDNLAEVAARLDRFPNYYVDMAAVVNALGRQPVTARRFFIKYQDRILFSTDGGYGLVNQEPGWTAERLFRSYIEFLETANEYVEYPMWGAHSQGRWRIYGLDLPNDVLEKIYVRNAERIIPTAATVAQHLAGDGPVAKATPGPTEPTSSHQ